MTWRGNPDRRSLLLAAGSLAVVGGLGNAGPAPAIPAFREDPFRLGVASGDPWPDGFVIWTRLVPQPFEPDGGMPPVPVPVGWEVAEDDQFRRIVRSGETIARPELAHSVHVDVTGLLPGRDYWYRFGIAGAARSQVGRARTAPRSGSMPERIRLGIAGCQAYPQGWYDAWRHMSREPDLDAIFHYGDYIYEYGSQSSFELRDALGAVVNRRHMGGEVYSLDDYRRRYAQYKLDPDLQAAHASAAFIMSFDDHEVDNNWAGLFDQDGTPPEAFALRRFAAMQAWYEHVPVRRAQFPRPDGLTMYRRFDYGALFRMHVLDTRSYRSDQLCEQAGESMCRPPGDPEETMLGGVQEAWLGEGLRNTAQWNIIAQQVRVMPLHRRMADGALLPEPTDTWGGYRSARDRLVQTISGLGLTNVVVASGDAHMHNVGTVPLNASEPEGPAVATEFLASSISSGGDGTPVTPTIQEYLTGNNANLALANHQRGYQLFDLAAGELSVDVKVMTGVQAPGGEITTLARFQITPERPELHRCQN